MKTGAYDFIPKPFTPDEFRAVLNKAVEERRAILKDRELVTRPVITSGVQEFISESPKMETVFNMIKKVAPTDSNVLIIGESGTGKELIARAIHFEGDRSNMPLVPVNCGGIPETLLESELFGYKRGAFTGADKNKKGLFQEAEGGTIFLDEIGEMPLDLQVKLLRVLQENEVRMIGDSKSMKIDVRVIAATAKDLEQEVKKGAFREDLFYRLNVLSIKIPPLRARTEDIPLLCDHFIDRFNNRLNFIKFDGLGQVIVKADPFEFLQIV